jgi:hypothetical protein
MLYPAMPTRNRGTGLRTGHEPATPERPHLIHLYTIISVLMPDARCQHECAVRSLLCSLLSRRGITQPLRKSEILDAPTSTKIYVQQGASPLASSRRERPSTRFPATLYALGATTTSRQMKREFVSSGWLGYLPNCTKMGLAYFLRR